MRKFSHIHALASAAVLLLVVSCADLLQGNIFENFAGPPGAGEVLSKHVQADGTVDPGRAGAFVRDLEDAASSPRFFRDISAADRVKLTVALESVYDPDSGVALPVRQKAAILAGEVNMRDTDAGATANNVIDVLTGDGIDTFEDPRSLLDEIIPASAQGDPVKIKAILDNLVAAGNAYEAFGNTLGGDNTAPAGTNMGTVAQNALVAITVRNIVSANGGATALAASIADPDGEIEPPGGDVFGEEGTPLRNIFDAAGLGGVLGD
jgi:hypothetical protein